MSKFKAGETYRTRNKSIARIYATDGKEDQEIHGAIDEGDGWKNMCWYENGKFLYNKNESAWDLMPETEYWYCVAYVNSTGKPVMKAFRTEKERDKFISTFPDDVKTYELEKRVIEWEEVRNNFFKECTTETPREEVNKKVNIAPHDLFEWFKREITEYTP